MLIADNAEKGRGSHIVLLIMQGLSLESRSPLWEIIYISTIRAQSCSGNNKSADYSSVRIVDLGIKGDEGEMKEAELRQSQRPWDKQTGQEPF